MNDSVPYSPDLSSPVTPWSDANSTFGNSLYLDSSRAGSSTSLWTASSASSVMEAEDDVSSELRCLELLAELEREKRRKSAEQKRVLVDTEASYTHHSRDESLPDVVQPLDLTKARAARYAKQNHQFKSKHPSDITADSLTQRTQRLSRRASFTTTDLAELDIDAILDAYTSEALAKPPFEDQNAITQQSIPRSKNSYNLHREVNSPAPQSALPAPPGSSMQRNSTAYSVRSTRSSHSNGSTITRNDRRAVGPFPTITRQRSNGSLASRKLPFDATSAPPLPCPPSSMPTSVPMPNRTFSSFSRESNASSTGSHHTSPLRSRPMSPHMSYASSTMSRQTSSASTTGSFRWSVATSSTVPTLLSDGSSDCGASRRGSIAPSSVGSFRQSPGRSRRRPSAPFPGSPDEQEEDGDRYWDRRGSVGDDNEEEDMKDGGLISWEDFADELANLPVPAPSRPSPRRMNSQGSGRSARSKNGPGATRSPFSSQYSSPSAVYASPESLRSTATLTSLSSSKAGSPFPSASPSPSPTDTRARAGGKKGILQGLRTKKSTRDLVSVFA